MRTPGRVPAKRHVAVRQPTGNGSRRLLVEEVMGYEGFSGNETILYHLNSPCRLDSVGEFSPVVRNEWVPEAHVHRLADTEPIVAGGDPVSGRRLPDVQRRSRSIICKPGSSSSRASTTREGDEVLYIHRGGGCARSLRDGAVPGEGLRRDPARDHAHVRARRRPPGLALLPHPRRDRNPPTGTATATRAASRARALLAARLRRAPSGLETWDESGEFPVTVVRDGYQERYLLDRHPFDTVGWDGYVWPYAFNAGDFEPRAGRFHLPPPTRPSRGRTS